MRFPHSETVQRLRIEDGDLVTFFGFAAVRVDDGDTVGFVGVVGVFGFVSFDVVFIFLGHFWFRRFFCFVFMQY